MSSYMLKYFLSFVLGTLKSYLLHVKIFLNFVIGQPEKLFPIR